ncbi:hypothetical protein CONPUDRAFT_61444, partial [Coniophora puteana RWD-64-598 SS2]
YTESGSRVVSQQHEEYANVALLRLGLLGNTPEAPETAIDLHTLEVYHRLRRRHAQLGIQPYVRVLCDINDINYTTQLRESFSNVFDVYLSLQRSVRGLIDAEMGRATPNWRALHGCPCCHYKVSDEFPLQPAVQYAADGNNSARRTESAGSADQRIFKSDYFLSREEVDTFKNEVRGSVRGPQVHEGDDHGDGHEGADEASRMGRCTSDFRVSRPDGPKKALDIYETTGIFAAACRHGVMQKICEMVRSGELAKYGLAVTNHLLDVHGHDINLAQDTGCAFSKTIANSPLLADKARTRNLSVCVNAFHGWAHSRLCQLNFHPLYRKGAGLSDLEQMERAFSASNATVRLIRYASRFHFLQGLDLHFLQWDEDRYGELSTFLCQKYRQALTIITEYSPAVQEMCQRLSITPSDIDTWIDLERTFLMNLKEEPDDRKLAAEYWQRVSAPFKVTIGNIDYEKDASETLLLENTRRHATEEYLVRHRVVTDLETKLGVRESWSKSSEEYRAAAEYLQHQDFYKASDRVQLLVAQRLQELTKSHIQDTGYKMRKAIGKAIERRSTAVRTAITHYNKLAAKMNPPATQLRWDDIVQYTFLSELEILKHSYFQQDVREQAWAKPVNRDAAIKHFKIQRAREEINRLNVEARRLRTWVNDELDDIKRHKERLEKANPLLAAAMTSQFAARIRANHAHLRRLDTLERLPGYSGTVSARDTDGEASREDNHLDLEDEELHDSMHKLSLYVENMD